MPSPTALSTHFLIEEMRAKMLPVMLFPMAFSSSHHFGTCWKLSLTLWISKHFRSCNNATSLIKSGTSSMSSTKQNRGYRINCRENYLSLNGGVCLSLTFTVYQISLAPLFDRQKPTDKTKPSNQTRRMAGCSALYTQPSCTAGSAERPAVTLAGWKKLESQSQDESKFCKHFLDLKMTKKSVHNCFDR